MSASVASPAGLSRVAVYERELPVSEERVWENVRDWEHLPWLHASSFASIALEGEGPWGWRARIGTHGGGEILLELMIDPGAPRYVSRTVEGPGAGAEIWTRVDARGDRDTAVRVEFWVPETLAADPAAAARLGDMYVDLYTRLWDEDESMMTVRSRALEGRGARRAPGGRVGLGTLDELRARLPVVARYGGRAFRIVELDGELVAHSVVCPHLLGPLEEAPVEDGRVVCPWHGYAFDVRTGGECSGRRLKLAPPPRVRIDPADGQVHLEDAAEATVEG